MRGARRPPRAELLQRDAVLVAGGLRALLLQLAHPAVGHGVANHSDFATDPMRRLWHTLGFLAIVAAGDDAVIARFARVVADRHRPVVGEGAGGVQYDARDPALQFWVAATIHDTALRITEAVHGPLPAPTATALLTLDGRVAMCLGLPAHAWPTTPDAFDRAFAGTVRTLRFDETTLEVAATLLAGRGAPWWVRRAMPAAARATLPTLPAALGAQLAPVVPPGPSRLPALIRLAPSARLIPGPLRRLPAHLVVIAARRAVARADAPAHSPHFAR